MFATLISHELRRLATSRLALVFVLVAPVLATVIGTIALGAPHKIDTTIAIYVPDANRDLAERALAEVNLDTVGVEFADSEADARGRVRSGDAAAAVVLPAAAGEPALVITNRAEVIPEAIALDLARLATWGAPVLDESAVDTAAVDRTLNGGEVYGPVIAIFFLFLTCGLAARSMQSDRDSGALTRMRTMGVSTRVILGAKATVVVLVGTLQLVVVLATMSLLFGSTWGSIATTAILTVAITLAVGAVALAIAAFSRSADEAHGLEIVVALVFAALGGSLVPLSNLPDAARRIADAMPNGAAIRAFHHVAAGSVLSDVWKPVLYILLFAFVIAAVALAVAGRVVAR